MRALGLRHAAPAADIVRLGAHLNTWAPPLASVDYQSAVRDRLSPLGNDRYGCCVPAGLMHAAQVRMAVVMGSQWEPTTGRTLALYGALTGFDPATGVPDEGTDLNVAMSYVAAHGLGLDVALLDMLHPVAVSRDPNEQSLATGWFGWVGYSLALPLAAQEMSTRLDVPACGLDAEAGKPGGWGAHFVVSCAYESSPSSVMRRCITWGQDMEITEAFLDAYLLRADSGWSNDALDAMGVSLDGLDRDGLVRAAAMFGS